MPMAKSLLFGVAQLSGRTQGFKSGSHLRVLVQVGKFGILGLLYGYASGRISALIKLQEYMLSAHEPVFMSWLYAGMLG